MKQSTSFLIKLAWISDAAHLKQLIDKGGGVPQSNIQELIERITGVETAINRASPHGSVGALSEPWIAGDFDSRGLRIDAATGKPASGRFSKGHKSAILDKLLGHNETESMEFPTALMESKRPDFKGYTWDGPQPSASNIPKPTDSYREIPKKAGGFLAKLLQVVKALPKKVTIPAGLLAAGGITAAGAYGLADDTPKSE